jgi:protocatechuate 3,4-dioxygenase beta subunit
MIEIVNRPFFIARGLDARRAAGKNPLIGRRELLVRGAGLLAFAGVADGVARIARAATTYVATPEETEGPYWVDEQLNRSDLQVDPSDNSVQAGFPLVFTVTVSSLASGAIAPLSGAIVDIWHCNVLGIYSDESAYNPGGGDGTVVTTGKKFLRGYQISNTKGQVRFLSIYPGWYTSRTAHIHCRVRIGGFTSPTTNFTTQFFFPDTLTDQVYLTSPYNQRTSARDTYNTSDSVYTGLDCATNAESGSESMFNITTTSAYASASYNVILDLTSNASTCTSTNPGGGSLPGGSPPAGSPPTGGPPPGLQPRNDVILQHRRVHA